MAQALIFLAPGFEEVEMLTVVDLLRRANITVDMVSITDSLQVTGSHNITISSDILFPNADFKEAQMIILPGGIPGTPNLLAYTPLTEQIKAYAKEGKYLSAVCAAPTIFSALGLLEGKKATCHPDHTAKLTGAVHSEDEVVTDDIFITSRGLGTSIPFAAAIIERFRNKKVADTVLKQIVYRSCC